MNTQSIDSMRIIPPLWLETPSVGSLGHRIINFGHEIAGDLKQSLRIQVMPADSIFHNNVLLGCIAVIGYSAKRVYEMPLDHSLRVISCVALESLGLLAYQIEKRLPNNSQAKAVEEKLVAIEQQLDQLVGQSGEKQVIIDGFKTILTTYKEIKALSNKVDAQAKTTGTKLHELNADMKNLDDMLISLLHATSFQEALIEAFIPLSTCVDALHRTVTDLTHTHKDLQIDEARIRKKALSSRSAPNLILTQSAFPHALDLKA